MTHDPTQLPHLLKKCGLLHSICTNRNLVDIILDALNGYPLFKQTRQQRVVALDLVRLIVSHGI